MIQEHPTENKEQEYVLAVNTKGFCKLNYKTKLRLQSLKLYKNKLFIAPVHNRYLAIVKKCSNILTWTIANQESILKILKTISKKKTLQNRIWASYSLNSPKKGFKEDTRNGYRDYEVFRKNYLNPMLYRKNTL